MLLIKKMQDHLKYQNIKMMVVDAKTGQKANYGTTDTIIEVFKSNKLKNSFDENNNLNYKIINKNIFNFY